MTASSSSKRAPTPVFENPREKSSQSTFFGREIGTQINDAAQSLQQVLNALKIMPREVITLQFGPLANFAGSHFWNIQEDILGLQDGGGTQSLASQIDSSVLFRERQTTHGDLYYSPRVVLFDAKGSLGGVSAREAAHLPEDVAATWGGAGEVHRAPPTQKPQFLHELDLEYESSEGTVPHHATFNAAAAEETQGGSESRLEAAARALDAPGAVRYFTDYATAQIDPRSIHIVEGLWHGGAEQGTWAPGGGSGWLGAEDGREEAADRIRVLAEEADSLEGFQCLADDLSAWGGIATEVLQEARDDYGPGRPVVMCALRSLGANAAASTAPEVRRRRLSEGLSTALLSQQCDVFIPVGTPTAAPLLSWRQGDRYHESALFAAAFDAATLPYRLSQIAAGGAGFEGGLGLRSLADLLTPRNNTPMVALSMALPCPSLPKEEERSGERGDARAAASGNAAAGASGNAVRSFTAAAVPMSGPELGGADDSRREAECIVLRGARAEGRKTASVEEADAALITSLQREGVRCTQHAAVATQAMPVPVSFPDVFAKTVSRWGDVVPQAEAMDRRVERCPVLLRMASTTAFEPALRGLARQWSAAAASTGGQAALGAWGVDDEQGEEVRERLLQLAHAYDEHEV